MKTIIKGLFLLLALNATQLTMAHAVAVSEMVAAKVLTPTLVNVAQDAAKWPIKPSQAALIAQDAHPGSIVLGVKLLPSGEYAVTLKTGGSVQKVLVDATSGSLG